MGSRCAPRQNLAAGANHDETPTAAALLLPLGRSHRTLLLIGWRAVEQWCTGVVDGQATVLWSSAISSGGRVVQMEAVIHRETILWSTGWRTTSFFSHHVDARTHRVLGRWDRFSNGSIFPSEAFVNLPNFETHAHFVKIERECVAKTARSLCGWRARKSHKTGAEYQWNMLWPCQRDFIINAIEILVVLEIGHYRRTGRYSLDRLLC